MTHIILGFPTRNQTVESFNKIGGLFTANQRFDQGKALKHEALICGICGKIMPLLLQLSCPLVNGAERVLCVFMCKSGLCSQFRVFRHQSSVEYSPLPSIPLLSAGCFVCGLFAASRCGGCSSTLYCSKQHQVLDWNNGHKESCGITQHTQSISSSPTCRSIALYPTTFIEDDDEPEEWNSDDGQNDNPSITVLPQVEEEEGDDMLMQETETISGVDDAFLAFQKRIALAPDQLLRYCVRDDDEEEIVQSISLGDNEDEEEDQKDDNSPLWVADWKQNTMPIIDPCPHCNARRTFEFQIMPQVLLLLGIDHRDKYAQEWGTIAVFTCSANCAKAEEEFVEEFFIRQDFSQAGVTPATSLREE